MFVSTGCPMVRRCSKLASLPSLPHPVTPQGADVPIHVYCITEKMLVVFSTRNFPTHRNGQTLSMVPSPGLAHADNPMIAIGLKQVLRLNRASVFVTNS
ncbi:MAG: hypothetical protein JSR95_02980 [Proteobacteria bacterium]|nr:hypothetical protein [Pseudomonadota bacterium]